jgi:molybdate transport system substrate-binding protein
MLRRTSIRSAAVPLALAVAAGGVWGSTEAVAAEVKVAVAANFTDPAKEIAALFEKVTGHKLVLSFGATGQFYAQITQGAPFQVFLAADKATPAKAIGEGHAIKGTAFTYAVGKLVLFSKTAGLIDGEATLKLGKFAKLAIANPAAAPYGAAAVQTMKALGVYDAVLPKIVQGQNIAQTYQFVETGNAEAGFVALSQVAFVTGGSRWVVPAKYHSAIDQDAVLLKPGSDSAAAKAFMTFLKSSQARVVIEKFGYGMSE